MKRSSIILLLLFFLIGCQGNNISLPDKTTVFFLFTGTTWGICVGQLVELDKRFEEIEKLTQSGKVDVRIIVPGTEFEIEQLKKEMNFRISIEHSTNLAYHQALGFIAKENGQTYLNRGYAITSGGKIIKSVTTNEAGLHSLEIVEEAIKMSR